MRSGRAEAPAREIVRALGTAPEIHVISVDYVKYRKIPPISVTTWYTYEKFRQI
jgi:hypothetical protein